MVKQVYHILMENRNVGSKFFVAKLKIRAIRKKAATADSCKWNRANLRKAIQLICRVLKLCIRCDVCRKAKTMHPLLWHCMSLLETQVELNNSPPIRLRNQFRLDRCILTSMQPRLQCLLLTSILLENLFEIWQENKFNTKQSIKFIIFFFLIFFFFSPDSKKRNQLVKSPMREATL